MIKFTIMDVSGVEIGRFSQKNDRDVAFDRFVTHGFIGEVEE